MKRKTKKPPPPTMIQSPSQYLANKVRQESTPYVINNDGEFYVCKGILIPRAEFNSHFPMAETIRVLHSGQQKGDGIGSAGI